MSSTKPEDSPETPPSLLSDPDMLTVRATFRAALEVLPPPLAAMSHPLVDRLWTPNWVLEWCLPRWLGDTFGLRRDLTQALVLSNGYGLAFVRLQDDLIDGEVEPEAQATTVLLSTALYHLWLSEYVQLFSGKSLFWDSFEEYLKQWLRATLDNNRPVPGQPSELSEEHLLRLAERGAPLKVCCVGACLLADREADVPTLTMAIDHLLIAAVLLDHAQDWARDLDAGRYNAFVDYVSSVPQTPAWRGDNRRRMREEIYLRDGARGYFELAKQHASTAREGARALGCPGLEAFLDWLQDLSLSAHRQLTRAARERLGEATEQIFGPEILKITT